MGLARARVLFTLRKIFRRVKAGPRACARTAHGTRGSLARWPPQSLPHQFAGRVSASANPRQHPRFRAYQPAYHPSAYRSICKVLTGSHTPLSVRTRPRTASLHTVPKVRFGQVSVETPLEICGWNLKFYEVPKVRFRCYSGRYSRRYSLQKSALSLLSRLLSALQKSALSLVTGLVTMRW